ncbi:MAG TPA: hypothetical protein VEW25_13720 [Allosphingosinicella sp.]|nr:hypothetical protein [Allosphingosinicella sp.]
MPPAETTTGPDAPSKSARSENPAASSGDKPERQDPARAALVAAADTVMKQDAKGVANRIVGTLEAQLKALVKGDDPKSADDPCQTPKDKQDPSPQLAALCVTRRQAEAQAEYNFDGSVEDASAALDAAKRTWTRARDQYDFSIETAQIALDQAVTAAIAAYDQKFNEGSGSRMNYLYFTEKQAVAAALLAFECSAQSTGTTFASATGTLIASYQTYLTTIPAAAAQQLDDQAAAQQAFWQSVEGVLDTR